MARITDSAEIALLENHRFEVYDLVQIEGTFNAPWANGINVTNYPVDVTVDINGVSTQFMSIGAFLSVGDFVQSSDLEVEGLSFALSGLPPVDNNGDSFFQILLNETWKGYPVKVHKLLIDDPSDITTAVPVEIFRGISTKANVEISDDGNCDVSIEAQDDFATFDVVAGRRNNPSESAEIATKQYINWPVTTTWQKIGTFNDFSSWSLTRMSGPVTGTNTKFFSPYGHQNSSSFAETATSGAHYVQTPSLGSLASGESMTFSCMIAPCGDGGEDYEGLEVELVASTNYLTGPQFDFTDYTISTTGSSEFTDVQLVTYHDEDDKPTPVQGKQPWVCVIVTFTAPVALTSVKFRLKPQATAGATHLSGDVNRGFQICNASAYLGSYDYDYTFRFSDYYLYAPDAMFKESAETNKKIRWIDAA